MLGCAAVLGLLVLLIAGAACAVVFFESGADSGDVHLQRADAYAPASVEFDADHHIFVVRAIDGEFFLLDDLDAANRASPGRRCRVFTVAAADPVARRALSQYEANFSPQGRSLALVFQEPCNGALYDATGVRLDQPGERNLDRYPVLRDDQGRLVVDTNERRCSRREGSDWYAPVVCD
jgi:hypothetical protein